MTTQRKEQLLNTPDQVAAAGEAIYRDNYKESFERKYLGQFAVIDVSTGKAYVAEYPEQALEKAKADSEAGLYHLIRIGAPGAFRVSYASPARSHPHWPLHRR